MLKVVQNNDESNENTSSSSSLLDEIVRDGARQMLAAALQAEVSAYVEAFADEVDEDGRRLVVRNGHHQPREVTTAAGAVPVRAPRVNDKRVDETTGQRKRFASAILPAWRAVNAPHLVALVRAGATFKKGVLVERPADNSAHEPGGEQQVA